MKKIILSMCLAAVALMGTTASAKTFGWGITGGLNVPEIDWSGDVKAQVTDKSNYNADNGWYAGVTAMVSVPVIGFGVDGAVLYSQEKVSDADVKSISVPIHLRYDFNLPLANKIVVPFVMAGPQFNYGLDEFSFDITTLDKETLKEKTETLSFEKANNWKLDLGAGVILFNHLQVSYSYVIPMGNTGKLMDKDITGTTYTAFKNYKAAAHRIGVTYYF